MVKEEDHHKNKGYYEEDIDEPFFRACRCKQGCQKGDENYGGHRVTTGG